MAKTYSLDEVLGSSEPSNVEKKYSLEQVFGVQPELPKVPGPTAGLVGFFNQKPRASVLEGVELPQEQRPAPVRAEFIDALQANLNALPEAERTAKLQELLQRPDVYGKAAQVIAGRYEAMGKVVSPAQRQVTDLRLEPQTERFIEQGAAPEVARNLARQQAMRGQIRPDLQQMRQDIVGEQAAAEAERVAKEMEGAGFGKRVLAEVGGQARQAGLGLISMAADLAGDEEMQRRVAGASRIEREMAGAIPKGKSIFEKSAQQAIASAVTQTPMTLLSIATGTPAPLLMQVGVQQLGSSYNEGRQAGLTPEMALARAVPMTAAEVLFERFGMEKALAGLGKYMVQAGPKADVTKYFAEAVAKEIPSELATTLTQYGIDVLPGVGLERNPSLVDLYKQLEETLRQTVIQAGATAGVTAPAAKLAQKIEERLPTQREGYREDLALPGTAEAMARERGFLAQPTETETPSVVDVLEQTTTPVEGQTSKILDLLQELEATAAVPPVVEEPAREVTLTREKLSIPPADVFEEGKEEVPEIEAQAPVAAENVPTVTTEKEAKEQHAVVGMPIVEAPVTEIKLSEEVPQFKSDADEAGVVEPLEGKFERTGVAPIQLWRRTNGDLEVISGRHRLDLAKRSGEQTIPAQIHDEASGFDATKAATLDAELNIRDGQGKVKDYVVYFEKSGITEQEAESRGLLGRALGKRAWRIASQGSPELIAAHRANVIDDTEADAIAAAAPSDTRLQAVGLKAVRDGKKAAAAANLMRAVGAISEGREPTEGGDLFGFDESAMKEAEDMARIATQKQSELDNRLRAIQGAARRPEIAKKEGVDIRDPQALKRRIDELKQERSAWDNWSTNPDLIEQIRAEIGGKELLQPQTEQELRLKAGREADAERTQREQRKEAEQKAIADEGVGDFVLTGSVRAADEAAARGQQTFLDIGRPISGEPSKRAPSVTRRAKTLRRQRDAGKISDMEFVIGVNAAIDAAEEAKYAKDRADRVRGADFIRQKLLEAKRKGWLSEEAVDLAEWFINKNPSLVDDLAIAIKSPKEEGVAGRYFDFPRIMVLMKESGNDETIVHEILHHLERMMPPDIRAAIRKEWYRQFLKAQNKASDDNQKNFFELLNDYHYETGVEAQFKAATTMLKEGLVPIEFYQYVNPSEFWAVNGSDIVSGRFDAVRGGVLQRLKNWLRELSQKMKSLFGLQSSAPIIRALDSLAKADGKFVSNKMLSEEALEFSSVKGKEEETKPVTKKDVEDTWLFGRDKAGKVGFGPGAKAYATVANIANKVLDKVYLKPVSPELGRALRNMKVKVDQVQKKIGEVAAEMNKLSPDERVMISDIIEGELKAGVHPPEHVLNLAAAIQSMMSRQSQELVELGMLSEEAANRWDNKYLPRFYERNLKNDVNAWAKAARAVFMKQPMMRGIKGSSLRARGMFEVINTTDLQEWIDAGWEQRDPDFDPKKSEETIVWRDYTKAEREDMGEIRDAMFRFVMGYNASQRDIALGRLYRDLAKNYASKSPKEGYVQVPDSKAEGTFAPKYGELAGKYVPKEIMDHLSANDHAMAEGVLKIYRAGLSKWKEGKTVLNPVSHANNVLSNLTMAHFAGVSYWQAHKYAGAIKDFVTKDPMVKEADEVGLFGGSFNQSELVKSMPPELRAMANLTESQLSRFGERIWDTFAYTVEVGGRKYGARPVLQWAYENEDMFFRYLIYRDARNRGMDPEDARDFSQEYIFTYDDLPKGARALRDYGMPFFSYTYKVVPVLARTALVYPWRYAAPATIAYTANALMYAMAANMGGDEDDWWGKVLYKYVTDPEFRKRANEIEAEERKHLPEWLKGSSAILSAPKAIRMGLDDATGLPMFLDISRIFPGGDLLDANNNAGGVALLQPLTPSNPVLTTLVAMLANKDMFLGKDVTKKTDTDEEKARKRAEWLWKQITPAISVGNYHFDRTMNVVANYTGKPITIDAGPMGVASYTGIGKDGLPVQPKHAMLQTMGIKIRPYDLEISKGFEESAVRQIIREIDFEISRINRQEGKGIISAEAAQIEREKLIKKKVNIASGLTLSGEEKD